MPYDDPRWMGGIGMIGTKPVYDAVMHCDLMLMVGTDYPYSNFLPTKPVVVQIDDRPEVLGRRAPTVLGAVGSVQPTLKLLLGRVGTKDGHRVLRRGDQGAPQVGRDARPAGRSGPQQGSHPSTGGGEDGRRSRRAATRSSPSTPGSTRFGRPTGFVRADRSGSSARSTTRPSGPRSARPTASRPWTVRARSSRSAATAASTC